MNPFFVSVFALLADVAFSTSSPRLQKNKETMINITNYFRENITTQPALDIFDKNISILQWYMYLNASS